MNHPCVNWIEPMKAELVFQEIDGEQGVNLTQRDIAFTRVPYLVSHFPSMVHNFDKISSSIASCVSEICQVVTDIDKNICSLRIKDWSLLEKAQIQIAGRTLYQKNISNLKQTATNTIPTHTVNKNLNTLLNNSKITRRMKMPADFTHSKVLAQKTPSINPGAEV